MKTRHTSVATLATKVLGISILSVIFSMVFATFIIDYITGGSIEIGPAIAAIIVYVFLILRIVWSR